MKNMTRKTHPQAQSISINLNHMASYKEQNQDAMDYYLFFIFVKKESTPKHHEYKSFINQPLKTMFHSYYAYKNNYVFFYHHVSF